MPDYNTLYQITQAIKGGAGNDPGQRHIDDYIRENQIDAGPASALFGLTGDKGAQNYFRRDDKSREDIEAAGENMYNERGAKALAQAKQYDPNAHIDDEGYLIFDKSKLPKWAGPSGNDMKKAGGWASLNENNAGDRLKDNQYVVKDANYGDYTVRGNLKEASNDQAGGGIMGQAQTYMPSIVSAIMAAGMGAAAGPMLGGALSAGIGPGGIADKLTMGEDIDWKKAGINAAMSIGGGYLANVAQGMIPSELTQMLQTVKPWIDRGMTAMKAYQLYQQISKGQ